MFQCLVGDYEEIVSYLIGNVLRFSSVSLLIIRR